MSKRMIHGTLFDDNNSGYYGYIGSDPTDFELKGWRAAKFWNRSSADKERSSLLLLNNVNANYIRRRITKGTITFPYRCSINYIKARFIGYLCRHGPNIFSFVEEVDNKQSLYLHYNNGSVLMKFFLKDLFNVLHSNNYVMRTI